MAPLAMNKSLTKRRKLAISALAGTAGAAALFAFSSAQGGMEFDPYRDLSAYDDSLRSGSRALANTVSNYDTDQSTVTIPAFYDNVANVWDVYVTDDQPMLWYVPRSGGNTLSKVFTQCLDFVSANSIPATLEGGLEPTNSLQINTLSDGGRYVNLDMSNVADIAKADAYNIVQGNTADVITTQHLQAASAMFVQTHRGRLFTMLRHPVKRAVDLFFYRQRSTGDADFQKDVATLSLKEYAKSSHHIENFMVRTVVGKNTFDITSADVEMAKHILRRKFVIGIAEEKFFDVSVVRFEKYFGWWEDYGVMTNMTRNHCHHEQIKKGGHFGSHPKIRSTSEEYNILASRNWADMELYMWAKGLFKRQAVLPNLFV